MHGLGGSDEQRLSAIGSRAPGVLVQWLCNCSPNWVFLGGELPMARYYFHIRDGNNLIRDEEGIELPSLEAARAEAILVTARP